MKRLFSSFILLCLSILVTAQSPRMILIEEFTSATCNPSAIHDPNLDILIWSNSAKVVALKYQGPPYPTPDIMYNQNPVDVTNRANYYFVPYVPYGRIDGYEPGPSSPNIIDVDQALIDSVAAIPA